MESNFLDVAELMPVATINKKGLMPTYNARLTINNDTDTSKIYKVCDINNDFHAFLELSVSHPTATPSLVYVKISRHNSQNQELKGVKNKIIGDIDVYIDKSNNYLAVKLIPYERLSIRFMVGYNVIFNVSELSDENGLIALTDKLQ